MGVEEFLNLSSENTPGQPVVGATLVVALLLRQHIDTKIGCNTPTPVIPTPHIVIPAEAGIHPRTLPYDNRRRRNRLTFPSLGVQASACTGNSSENTPRKGNPCGCPSPASTHCYENRLQYPHTRHSHSTHRHSCEGRNPSPDVALRQSTTEEPAPIFIPWCAGIGLHEIFL